MNYRRARVGVARIFTVNLAQREGRLQVDHLDIVRNAVRYVKTRHPFHIDAVVVLPDHLHALWTLPPGDHDYATRRMLIKTNFSRRMVRGEHCPPEPDEQRRTWYLATPLLGTPDLRRP